MVDVERRDALAGTETHGTALDCIAAGIKAARPERVLEEALSLSGGQLRIEGSVYDLGGYDEIVVIGGGKAAGQAAAHLETLLGDILDGGVVVTDDPVDTERVDVVKGDHPVPSEAGVAGARQVRERAESADEETLVLAVLTGGGSALLPAPAGKVTLEDVRETTDALLESGASIDEINAVRKHASSLKGGQLARAAHPATVVTLAFSDVVGDDLSVIASGPTVPDATTYTDAIAVLDRDDLDVPERVRDHLEAGAAGERTETPGPEADFGHTRHHVLANAWTAISAARRVASERGYNPLVLSSQVEGEASEQGRGHAAVAREVRATGNPVEPPAVVLSGGECTVTVTGEGRGGPNQEFALAAALDLPGDAVCCAVDTDGRDGATGAAGAIADVGTVAEARRHANGALIENDAGGFLDDRDALVVTGRTGTNVNDLRVLVVE